MEKPWYREWYVQFCALAVLAGCLVIGVDLAWRVENERTITGLVKAKTDADALVKVGRFEEAIASYDDVARAKGRFPGVTRVQEAVEGAIKGGKVAVRDLEVRLGGCLRILRIAMALRPRSL